MKAYLYVGTALTAAAMAAAYAFVSPSATLAEDGASLLAGKVVSSAYRTLYEKAHADRGEQFHAYPRVRNRLGN